MNRDGWWSWPGAVALVLAITLGGGWAMGIYLAATPPTTRSVGTGTGLDVLNTVGGVLAGALATFVGASITQRARTRDDDRPRGDDP